MAAPIKKGPESRPPRPGPRRELLGSRRAVLIALPPAALLLVLVVVVLAGTSGLSAGASSPGKNTGSATVTRRDLIATDTESGTLGFGGPETVYNRRSGTITSLPSAGTVVKSGGTLFTVDNAPVVLMNGTLPAYRTLSGGVSDGPDIKELEQNLRDLGFDPNHAMAIDDTFDSATMAAVERWQASLGQTQTGTVTLGSVVFLPGPRRVSAVTASLGSTGGSSGAASSATTASTAPVAHPEFVDLTTASPTSTTSTTSTGTTTTTTSINTTSGSRTPAAGSRTSMAALQALVALLKAETAELRAELTTARSGTSATGRSGPSSPSGGASGATSTGRSGRSSGSGGAGAAASGSAASGGAGASGASGSSGAAAAANAQAVLQTTSTELVATVNLDATKQSEAVQGQPVTVQMPDGSTVDGRISQVAAAAQTSSSSSSSGAGASASSGGSNSGSGSPSSTVAVTIMLSGHRKTAGLDQAAASVNFQQQKAAGVLAVPVTALLATAGGGYAVQEAAAPNRLIPVTTGLFAAGYVQVSGAGVYDGLQVTNSQG